MMDEVLLAISYATRPKLVNGGGMWSTIKMEGYDGGGVNYQDRRLLVAGVVK